MFAKDNEYLQEAAESLYVANADEIVRQKCYAREMAIGYELSLKDKIAEAESELAKRDAELAEKDAKLAEKDAELAKKDAELAKKDAELIRLQKLVGEE